MDVFLPIAQVYINPVEILLLSAIVGVLSGLFGVGGGFLMTPFLIFMGVPPAYAVANEANNILATSVSGSTAKYSSISARPTWAELPKETALLTPTPVLTA